MILFILTLILAVVGIAIVGKGKVTINKGFRDEKEVSLRPIGALVLFAAFLTLVFNVFTIVPTRNIAVSMAFGKPTGTLGNGFHLIAPWESTEEYDASIQTLKLDGDDETPAPTVRLANAATARVDVTVQWQINPDADITQLHLDYRNFENIQDNVVKRQLQAGLNAVFEGYDPLIALKGGQQQTTLAKLAEQVQAELSKLVCWYLSRASWTFGSNRINGTVTERTMTPFGRRSPKPRSPSSARRRTKRSSAPTMCSPGRTTRRACCTRTASI